MNIKQQTIIPAHVTITRIDPAPRSKTCPPSARMRVKGFQTRLPMPTKGTKAERNAASAKRHAANEAKKANG